MPRLEFFVSERRTPPVAKISSKRPTFLQGRLRVDFVGGGGQERATLVLSTSPETTVRLPFVNYNRTCIRGIFATFIRARSIFAATTEIRNIKKMQSLKKKKREKTNDRIKLY